MTFDEMRLQYEGFTESIVQKLIRKMPMALKKAQGLDFIPYTVKDGQWQPGPFDGICWWTNGFWPGEMWEMYRLTGDAVYRAEAERAEKMLDDAFTDYDHLHHDVGFMWLISSGADFRMTEDCIRMIPHDCELVFLCNPNNPTGLLTEKGLLQSLSERCRKIGSVLAVDECFLDFCAAPEAYSLVEALAAYPNLVILKAFTKTCAMAGLRLGYALCGNEALASRLQSAGPPWAVSHIAQAAGAAALREKDYGSKLRKTVSAERRRMIDALVRLVSEPEPEREARIARGLEWVKRFSWADHAAGLAKLIKEVKSKT